MTWIEKFVRHSVLLRTFVCLRTSGSESPRWLSWPAQMSMSPATPVQVLRRRPAEHGHALRWTDRDVVTRLRRQHAWFGRPVCQVRLTCRRIDHESTTDSTNSAPRTCAYGNARSGCPSLLRILAFARHSGRDHNRRLCAGRIRNRHQIDHEMLGIDIELRRIDRNRHLKTHPTMRGARMLALTAHLQIALPEVPRT